MVSLAVFPVWLRLACGNELHPAGQTLETYGLLISGRKWKSCHMTKRLRPVRLWNQLSGNGQMGPSPMTSPKEVSGSRPFHGVERVRRCASLTPVGCGWVDRGKCAKSGRPILKSSLDSCIAGLRACSAFTYFTACTLAKSPLRPSPSSPLASRTPRSQLFPTRASRQPSN
jgi:hypothetical protein